MSLKKRVTLSIVASLIGVYFRIREVDPQQRVIEADEKPAHCRVGRLRPIEHRLEAEFFAFVSEIVGDYRLARDAFRAHEFRREPMKGNLIGVKDQQAIEKRRDPLDTFTRSVVGRSSSAPCHSSRQSLVTYNKILSCRFQLACSLWPNDSRCILR